MKKPGFRIGILALLALVSMSAAATDCAGFLDDTTCVKACTPPKVNDVKSGKCIASRSICEGAYFQPENVCLFSCPPRTIPGLTFEQKKECIPIDIPVLYPNAAKLNCTMSQYFDLINNVCASNTIACSGRVIPEIAACVSSCPDQLVQSSFLDSQNATVNACSVKPYVLPVECSLNQVRNVTSNTCLDSADNCVGFLIKEKALCVPKCPPESGAPVAVASATYSVCTEKPLACTSTQIFDKVHETCLNDATSCVGYLIPEKRMCVDECPDFNVVKSVSGANYKICVPCLFKDANNTCFESCPATMKQDNEKRICIEDSALSCSKYFVKIDSSCRDSCPYGTVANNNSSPKTCVPCSQSPQGCPDQSSLCNQKLSADKMICGPECPNLQYAYVEKDKPYQQCKQCDSKEKFVNLAGTECVDQCEASQAGDRATRRCISIDACTQYLFKENGFMQCGKACPMNQMAASTAVGNSTYFACSTCDAGKFLDISSQACVATCAIFDAKQTACLKSISDCIGFISSDNSSCGTACASGQVFSNGSNPGQFLCADSCPTNRFLWEGKCHEKCVKGTYPDSTTNKCVESSKCTDIVSLDGKNCVKSCDAAGQFVQSDDKNMKMCKICQGKVSSDGSKCEKECASGDVFDVDQKKCLSPSDSKTCSGKIYSGDKKNCSNMCPKGSLQYTDAAGKKSCLSSISDCKDYVSSDLQKCVSACGNTEAVVTQNSTRFCRICAFGATLDKSACSSADRCDAATQLFDIDLGQCVVISACESKLLSVDGLKCSTKCVFPEANRPNVSTTQCYTQCGSDEIRVKDKGCVASSECDGYISAGSGGCVEECVHVREAIDSTISVPKTCKKCLTTQIPAVVVSDGKKVIECQEKLSSDTDASIATTQATGMSDILGTFTKIAPEQMSDLKDQVSSVSDTLEATMKSLKSNLELSDDEKKAQLKSYLANVKDIAKQFSQKVDQSTASSSSSSSSSSDAPESQIILGSSEFQLITESLKTGNVFNLNFSLDNFLSSSPSPLQTDPALVAAADLVSSTSSDITTLQAVNLATNPYCADATKCSSYGLFSVEYTLASDATRRLSAADGKTFSTVYQVSASNLSKTICVSYDDVTGDMTPAVDTQADASSSTITCTFYSNSDLFLDNSCQYIDASVCAQAATVTQQSEPTSGVMNVFSLALLAVFLLAINL